MLNDAAIENFPCFFKYVSLHENIIIDSSIMLDVKKETRKASSLREKSVLVGNLPKIVHKKSALYASMMLIFMFLFPTKFLV